MDPFTVDFRHPRRCMWPCIQGKQRLRKRIREGRQLESSRQKKKPGRIVQGREAPERIGRFLCLIRPVLVSPSSAILPQPKFIPRSYSLSSVHTQAADHIMLHSLLMMNSLISLGADCVPIYRACQFIVRANLSCVPIYRACLFIVLALLSKEAVKSPASCLADCVR
jgi:hypothetical protein